MKGKVLLLAVFVMCVVHLDAQICTGSLGDPIVNITFGAGANPGPQLPGSITNYQYISTDCPQDGFYTIRNNTSACFGDTWLTTTDHTGNSNGYFMLVNASVSPGTFYLDTVRGLCANTTFEFAAWVVNMLRSSACGGAGIQPNLTFRLERADGTIIQSYDSGNIPASSTPQWRQYGFFFTMPPGVSDVVLRIINNAPGGCGNDIALDDITFRACGPQITTAIVGSSSGNVTFCEGNARSYTFNANVSIGFNNPVVQWQESKDGGAWTDIAGATTTTYTKNFSSSTAAGTYGFRLVAAEAGNMSSAQCRVASSPLSIIVISNPVPAAKSNSPVCEGQTLMLDVTAGNANWTGSTGFTATGSHVSITNVASSAAGRYRVTATNTGCTRLDSVDVVVSPVPVIGIGKNKVDICRGDSAQVPLNGASSYTWQPVTGLSYSGGILTIMPADSTAYVVKGYNTYGCFDSVLLQANVIRNPLADAGDDRSMIQGSPIQLSGKATGDSIFYTWMPNAFITGANSLSPFVDPPSDTSYILRVGSYLGCKPDEDTVHIHVFSKLMVPNAFSPNGDGINDRWQVRGLASYPGAVVSVFDRWGHKILESQSFDSWDGTSKGKPLPVGVYYYLIDVRYGFAPYTGWLLLVR